MRERTHAHTSFPRLGDRHVEGTKVTGPKCNKGHILNKEANLSLETILNLKQNTIYQIKIDKSR